MFRILKVTGNSLSPLYEEGDFVFVIKIPFFISCIKPSIQTGDTIVFRHPYYGELIKQVEWLTSDGAQLYVIGTQKESTDSRTFGLVERNWVLGKAIWHIRKP